MTEAPRKSSLKTTKKSTSRKSSSAASTANGDIVEAGEHETTTPVEIVKEELKPPSERPGLVRKEISKLKDIGADKLSELHEAFHLFDVNRDGIICKDDLRKTLQQLGSNMPDNEIAQMLSEAPHPLDFDAFVFLLGYQTLDLDTEETLVRALATWDDDKIGLISEHVIRHDLMTWGDRFTKQELDLAFETAPIYINEKGQSMIDYIKFCKALCGLREKSGLALLAPPDED